MSESQNKWKVGDRIAFASFNRISVRTIVRLTPKQGILDESLYGGTKFKLQDGGLIGGSRCDKGIPITPELEEKYKEQQKEKQAEKDLQRAKGKLSTLVSKIQRGYYSGLSLEQIQAINAVIESQIS